jgi:methionine synthase I (cobalamin-dependent)
MINPVLERFRQGPVLCDGAMGTQLYAHGIPFQRCFDELCLSEPELIQRIHREYILAGAEIIQTNTYGANRFKLASYGLEDKVRDINFRAVKIAREAREETGQPVFLAGSIGPIAQQPDLLGRVALEEARAAFREQIEALLEAGADLLVLETFSALSELAEAVRAAQEACALPIVAEMTFTEEGQTLNGSRARPAWRPRRRCELRRWSAARAGRRGTDVSAGRSPSGSAAERWVSNATRRSILLHIHSRVFRRVRHAFRQCRGDSDWWLLWHHARSHRGYAYRD